MNDELLEIIVEIEGPRAWAVGPCKITLMEHDLSAILGDHARAAQLKRHNEEFASGSTNVRERSLEPLCNTEHAGE
jgi:hypothetical protein